MIDRKILIILCLLGFQVFFGRDLQEQIIELKQNAQFQYKKIIREDFLSSREKWVAADLDKLETKALQYRNFFYPASTDISTAMADLQQRIKEAGTHNNIQFVSLRAGEPQHAAEQGYAKLPVTFTLFGTPEQIGHFLYDLFSRERYLQVFTADLRPRKGQQLKLLMSLTGFKSLVMPTGEGGSS